MSRSGGRYIAGVCVLIAFQAAPLTIPFVWMSQMSTQAKSVLSGLLALGIPELGVVLAIAIIGRKEVRRLWRVTKVIAKRCYR
ncbi:MAG: hypothetical protein ACK5BQ_04150 [Ignavibacteria bacterium]